MLKSFFQFICLIFFAGCFGQSFKIEGSVKDVNNNTIAFANVVLKSGEDSEVINGTITNEDGSFLLINIPANQYNLEISYLGFKKQVIEISVKADTKLEDILLYENVSELDGVIITAKRPTVIRVVDRLIFNVENSTLSNNNVLDVLKQTPGVIVSGDKITVKQSTPVIYINDKRVHLSMDEVQQLLQGTTATNLKSIEVITNPPAKYEAEGGAVINIVMNKNVIAGYNGSIFGNFQQGFEFPKYSLGTSHFFKSKSVNAYLNYNFSPRRDLELNQEFINFFDDLDANQPVSSWETEYNRFKKSSNHNFTSNFDYDIDSKNTLSFSANVLVSPRDVTKANEDSFTQVYSPNRDIDSTFNSTNRSVKEVLNFGFSLDYNHKFNKVGEVLSINLHHTNYDFSNFQDVKTDYFLNTNGVPYRENRFQTFSSQLIKLYTGQLDYQLPLGESAKFEAGGKVSNIRSESILDQYKFENTGKTIDEDNSDVFDYNETNFALYSSYEKNWENYELKIGLRTEFTNINGISQSLNAENDNEYVKYFPSFYLLHKLKNDNELYLTYNKRIDRPRYNQLNPFKFFLNDNAFITGDPNLKPQIDDQVILGYTFNQKFTFEAYYRNEDNPTIQMILQDNNERKIIYKNTNIDQSISYGLDFLTYTRVIKNWNIYAITSLFYYENNFIALESNNQPFVTDNWNFYAEINNYFSFLEDNSLTLDLGFTYISPIVDGPSEQSETYALNINIRKNIWKNKASISLGVRDALNTLNFNTITKYLNQDTFYTSKRENRLVVFGFNYKFGNYRLKNNSKPIDLNERDRL